VDAALQLAGEITSSEPSVAPEEPPLSFDPTADPLSYVLSGTAEGGN